MHFDPVTYKQSETWTLLTATKAPKYMWYYHTRASVNFSFCCTRNLYMNCRNIDMLLKLIFNIGKGPITNIYIIGRILWLILSQIKPVFLKIRQTLGLSFLAVHYRRKIKYQISQKDESSDGDEHTRFLTNSNIMNTFLAANQTYWKFAFSE